MIAVRYTYPLPLTALPKLQDIRTENASLVSS
jgi:hypothetical protein